MGLWWRSRLGGEGAGQIQGEAWGRGAGRRTRKGVSQVVPLDTARFPGEWIPQLQREVRFANNYCGCSGVIRLPAGVGTISFGKGAWLPGGLRDFLAGRTWGLEKLLLSLLFLGFPALLFISSGTSNVAPSPWFSMSTVFGNSLGPGLSKHTCQQCCQAP